VIVVLVPAFIHSFINIERERREKRESRDNMSKKMKGILVVFYV